MNGIDLRALFVEAVAEHHAGRLRGAQAIYERILKLHPGNPDALHLLGVTFHQQGDHVRAISVIERAIAIRGGVPDYYGNLALALFEVNRFSDSAAASRRALELNPRFADAANTLGLTLIRQGEPEAAAAAFEHALSVNPEHIEALGNLATAYRDQGLIEDAIAGYREVLRRRPERANIHSNLIYIMHLHPGYDTEAIGRELDNFNRQFGMRGKTAGVAGLTRLPQEADISRDPFKKPLRVGFVSPDFRAHVVGNNLLPVFEQIDRNEIEMVGYCTGGLPDATTSALRGAMVEWRDIRNLSDAEAAALIKADRIDILVDLSLHSAGNRLTLFALKAAPVQISYLGYCGRTGLSTMDFRLTDALIDPAEEGDEEGASGLAEQPLYVSPYLCYRPLGALPEVKTLPALTNGFVTFGCMNNSSKVSAAALGLWLEILGQIPGSRLLLHALPGKFREACVAGFAQSGISLSRLEFAGRQSWSAYIETFHRIDIGLDPFPYGGGISTCDALCMGVPVVTLFGRSGVGRLSASLLRHVGFDQGVALSAEEYQLIAIRLAADLSKLSRIRGNLRSQVQNSPLGDPGAMARSITSALRQSWGKAKNVKMGSLHVKDS